MQTVGLGYTIPSLTRDARHDAARALVSTPSVLTPASAIALVSSNLYKLLGVDPSQAGLIAVEGDAFGARSRVVGVIEQGEVRLF